MSHDRDARIIALAAQQAHAFSRQQCRDAEFSTAMIRARLASGRWNELDRDVFALPSRQTWEQRLWAGTLLHPFAGLSHQTSAASLSLDGFRAGGPVHVTVPPVGSHNSRITTVHRSRHLDFERHATPRTMSFAQTIIQLAGVVGTHRLEGAVHSGVDADPTRLDRLVERMTMLADRRLPGMRRLEPIVADLETAPPTQSELERMLLRVVDEIHGMPPVRRQVRAPWADPVASIFDVECPSWDLILEADGRAYHERREAFEHDRWRDAEAAAHGLTVMRFTHRRLRHDVAGIVDQITRYGQARVRGRTHR